MFILRAVLIICVGVCCGVLADQLCLEGDFDSQLQLILQDQMVSPQELAQIPRILDDVRSTLQRRWKGAQVYPFGSLLTGLGMKSSDIDCNVRIPNYNSSANIYLIEETAKLFHEEPNLYSQLVKSTLTSRFPIFTFYHNTAHRYCDVVFKSKAKGHITTELIHYYFKLDERFVPLGVFLKIWFKFHHLTKKDIGEFRNYVLYALTIFYLQQKNMAPSIFELQRDSESHFIDNWDMSFNKISYNTTNTENLYQLLGGFFKYYSEFNFEEYIVSPFAGRPIAKSAFISIKSTPVEFSLYKQIVSVDNIHPLALNSDMCIQDYYEHNLNHLDSYKHEEVLKLISHIKFAAKMFDELPSDRFLRAIFFPNQQEVIEKKQIEDVIRTFKDNSFNRCINVSLSSS